MVAALVNVDTRQWLTQPGTPDQGTQRNDEEWLYEWPDGSLNTAPKRYIAHKAIGGWTYGRQDLVYGEQDNTYGLSLKATVFGGGLWHEGDALLVVKRSNYSIDETRGWKWGCAAGHTLFNHHTFNPATSKYTATCGTDLGVDSNNAGGFGGLWVHTEGQASKGYLSVPLFKSLSIAGGPTSLLPLPDGGYLGVLAGVNGAVNKDTDFVSNNVVTSIGLARFDASGSLMGNIKWLASEPGRYLSFPQLAPLGNGSYLFGYAKMAAVSEKTTLKFAYDDALRIPASYHLFEVDQNGNALTSELTLQDAGWGEQDHMVALSPGKVGWVYTPKPTRSGASLPACKASQINIQTYKQKQ